jgi:hypothetical protein
MTLMNSEAEIRDAMRKTYDELAEEALAVKSAPAPSSQGAGAG